MKFKQLNLSAYLLILAGAVIFASCNEDEDDIRSSERLRQKTEMTARGDYSAFERNNYSAEEIFKKTAEFSQALKNGNVQDMSVKDAVVTMETFWNYGVVAKQKTEKSGHYDAKDFQFTVPLQNDGNTINGKELEGSFKNFVSEVTSKMNGLYLNAGDISVINYDGNNVTFNLKILAYNGTAIISIDPTIPGVTVFQKYSDIHSMYVPADTTLDPNTFPFNYSITPFSGISYVRELRHLLVYAEEIKGFSVAVNLSAYDIVQRYKIKDFFATSNDLYIWQDQPTYTGVAPFWKYKIKDHTYISDTLLPSFIYSIEQDMELATNRYILPNTDSLHFYGYSHSGIQNLAPSNGNIVAPLPGVSVFAKFFIEGKISTAQIQTSYPPFPGLSQIYVSW